MSKFSQSVSHFRQLREEAEEGPKKRLTFMIAAPGTGKSTHIKTHMPGAKVVSADHYFEDPKTGEYKFDPSKLAQAHAHAQKMAEHHMSQGHNHVVVDNTNTSGWQLKPYLKMAAKHGYDVHMQHLTAPLDQIQKRGVHFPKDEASKKRLGAMKNEADSFAAKLHSLKDHPAPMKALDQAGEFKAPWETENGDNSDIHHLKHKISTIDTSEKSA